VDRFGDSLIGPSTVIVAPPSCQIQVMMTTFRIDVSDLT
jgi:hypothetical protein